MNHSSSLPPVPVKWLAIAAAAGLGAMVLTPLIVPNAPINPSYGSPLVPWFASAFANLKFVPGCIAFFVLGAALGAAQPRWWALLCCATITLPLILNAVNVANDLRIDDTSHNLFPFEFAILAFFALPALAGGVIGKAVGQSNAADRRSRDAAGRSDD